MSNVYQNNIFPTFPSDMVEIHDIIIFGPYPLEEGGSTGVGKIRLKAIGKLPFGILPGVAPNLISTQKTETLWGTQKSIIYLAPRGGIPEIHQAYYMSSPIKVIILI